MGTFRTYKITLLWEIAEFSFFVQDQSHTRDISMPPPILKSAEHTIFDIKKEKKKTYLKLEELNIIPFFFFYLKVVGVISSKD